MGTAEEHYAQLLAEHYNWMAGGLEKKVSENRSFFESEGIAPRSGGRALDLGCGSGFQTLALAGLGFEVLAIDTSEALLTELRSHIPGQKIWAIRGDMRDPGLYEASAPFEVVVCMGDSLTHLPSFEDVSRLVKSLSSCLEEGGAFVVGFRDLTAELTGIDRAIPVRLDDDRLMATFLEYEAEHVNVHDLIFVRNGAAWALQKSAYPKLRVGSTEFIVLLEEAGLRDISHTASHGFSTIISYRRANGV